MGKHCYTAPVITTEAEMSRIQPAPAAPGTPPASAGMLAQARELAALRALIQPRQPKADHLLGYPVARGGRA